MKNLLDKRFNFFVQFRNYCIVLFIFIFRWMGMGCCTSPDDIYILWNSSYWWKLKLHLSFMCNINYLKSNLHLVLPNANRRYNGPLVVNTCKTMKMKFTRFLVIIQLQLVTTYHWLSMDISLTTTNGRLLANTSLQGSDKSSQLKG